jgi:thioredoxin-like negative regulator of GroEL
MGWFDKLLGGEAVPPVPLRSLDDFRTHVSESEGPVILNVWSETCPPCRRLKPVLEKVSTQYAGRVGVVTVGSDAEVPLLRTLGVRATPTLIVYEAGEEVGRMTGFRPKGWFDEMIAAEFPDA